MRNVFAAALAVPILVPIYAGTVARRMGRRLPVAVVIVALVAAVASVSNRPTPATGTPPTRGSNVAASEFTTAIETGESPRAPIVVTFPSAMNGASVEALLTVDPATATSFAWDQTMTRLTVRPVGAWAIGTLHTITVEAGALGADGRPLARRIRAAFLTRGPTTATISAALAARSAQGPGASIRIAFSAPVDETTIAVTVSPKLPGHLAPAVDSKPEAPSFEFVPDAGLDPGTTYTVALADAARDVDGLAIVSKPASLQTPSAPAVIRFRPVDGATGVTWSQNLSVRFTQPMDRPSTEAAWTATQAGAPITGTFSWAEDDRVLVFNPSSALGYAQTVVLGVGTGATSRDGVALPAAVSATFTTAAKAVPAPRTTTKSSGGSVASIGGSTWAAVEAYYLELMNCTRTGGVVSSSGACSGYGSRAVSPLWQDPGITANVSRPYAEKLVLANVCSHFYTSTPADRLRAAGFPSYIWAENLGCQGGDPYKAVLSTHLFFQSEGPYNGGHYVNLMNAKYDRVGIGVWVSGSRLRLVVDFYHPL
ncbi:MAG: Ig-like domain-containing protein [Chloroflexi bacterium]|nr:Ig-like domain-containing protein [Chloroflexota bacterium]